MDKTDVLIRDLWQWANRMGRYEPPSLEDRIKGFADRAEAQFQQDWIMAIGMDVLRDREMKAKP